MSKSKRTSLKARSASVQAAMVAASPEEEPPKTGKRTAPGSKPVGLTIRLTPATHDAVRKIAFERRVSIHSLFIEGVEFVIKKHTRVSAD